MNLREIYHKECSRLGQAGQADLGEHPALYFLDEILSLRGASEIRTEDLREIHSAKLTYPGQRIIQDPLQC